MKHPAWYLLSTHKTCFSFIPPKHFDETDPQALLFSNWGFKNKFLDNMSFYNTSIYLFLGLVYLRDCEELRGLTAFPKPHGVLLALVMKLFYARYLRLMNKAT